MAGASIQLCLSDPCEDSSVDSIEPLRPTSMFESS